MVFDAWLPVGFKLPDSAQLCRVLFAGVDWQIYATQGDGHALVVHDHLCRRWQDTELIEQGTLDTFHFGEQLLWAISCAPDQTLLPVSEAQSPDTKAEALAFALAFRATRAIDVQSPLQDALYVEKITRLLPTYSISSRIDDDVVLGYWLTGGTHISAVSFRRLQHSMSWLGAQHLRDVVQTAGFETIAPILAQEETQVQHSEPKSDKIFELAGRAELAAFFNEHIIDIIVHRERYKALGIEFPSAVILHGPPGCGKTYAVEQLMDFLGWPSFQIDAASVASPYIHETSKKVAQIFNKAIESSPSVLVIDEMEAFLADREMGSGHHRVEEMAEFLRRIPEAVKNDVLVIAMTNRIEMIDPAIVRRGRFDHVIKVDFASEIEIQALLDKLLSSLPKETSVDSQPLVQALVGRPLSDIAFVVREGARLAVRSGKDRLDQTSLMAALQVSPRLEREGGSANPRRIGFL